MRPDEKRALRGWAVSTAVSGLIFMGAVACWAQSHKVNLINWRGIERAYATWMKDPSPSNAVALEHLLPRQHAPFKEAKGRREALEYIFAEEHLDFLTKRVRKGDASAARLAFRLLTIADGADAEWLDINLGALTERDPRLLLSLVKENGTFGDGELPYLGNLGPRYVDKFGAQCRELRKRARILSRVKDPDLIAVRKRAVDELQRQIREACGHAR